MLPQRHAKDLGHSAKSAGDRLQLDMHAPTTQQSQSGLTILSRDSAGIHHGRAYQTFSHDTRKQKEKAATAPMRVDVSVSGQLSATNDIRHITSVNFLFTH